LQELHLVTQQSVQIEQQADCNSEVQASSLVAVQVKWMTGCKLIRKK